MLGAITLDMIAVLLGGATALLPIYASDILHTGPWGLGVLRSAPALGALTVALWLSRHPLQRHAGRTMFAAVAVFGAVTIVFGLSRWFPLSFAALVLLGASDMISVVVRASLIQLGTPDAMRGRVSAVNAMFIGTSNQLGEFESGITAAWLGTVPSVVVGGIGTMLAVLLGTPPVPAARANRSFGVRASRIGQWRFWPPSGCPGRCRLPRIPCRLLRSPCPFRSPCPPYPDGCQSWRWVHRSPWRRTPPPPARPHSHPRCREGRERRSAWDSLRTQHSRVSISAAGVKGTAERWADIGTGRSLIKYSIGPVSGAAGYDGTTALVAGRLRPVPR
jgi:hypothetical protein